MKSAVGTKVGMTRMFGDDGSVIPVTLVQIVPMKAVRSLTKEKNGYEATLFSYELGKKTRFKENKISEEVGTEITVDSFKIGDIVKISGISKAKGFQGAVKRHGFHGMPASHGHHHVLRHVGSIGQRFPQHTLKGMRMAGRMGGTKITTRGLKVVSVDGGNKMIAVKGAVPGRRGSLLYVSVI